MDPETKAQIVRAWEEQRERHQQELAEIEECRRLRKRWKPARPARVAERRYSLAEAAEIFSCSETDILRGASHAHGVNDVWAIFLPVPIPPHLQSAYEGLWDTVHALLNEHDPAGLIAFGAPSDEYDNEQATIMPRLCEATDAHHLAEILHQEFASWFSKNIADRHDFQPLAEDLWSVWTASPFYHSQP